MVDWCNCLLACGEFDSVVLCVACTILTNSAREMAVGNTFGATALSSYGGFWLSFAIILTPGGFNIEDIYVEEQSEAAFYDAFGYFLMVRPISTALVRDALTQIFWGRDGSSSPPYSYSSPSARLSPSSLYSSLSIWPSSSSASATSNAPLKTPRTLL